MSLSAEHRSLVDRGLLPGSRGIGGLLLEHGADDEAWPPQNFLIDAADIFPKQADTKQDHSEQEELHRLRDRLEHALRCLAAKKPVENLEYHETGGTGGQHETHQRERLQRCQRESGDQIKIEPYEFV